MAIELKNKSSSQKFEESSKGEAIVDMGSQKNLISASLLQRLGLTTTPHPRPYSLGWIQKDMDTQERNAVYFPCAQKYRFEKDGNKYLVYRSKGTRNVEFTMACRARRLVNASQVIPILLVRHMESANKKKIPLMNERRAPTADVKENHITLRGKGKVHLNGFPRKLEKPNFLIYNSSTRGCFSSSLRNGSSDPRWSREVKARV
nr:hypothetical protein [Tanacetum cinerariifolium]